MSHDVGTRVAFWVKEGHATIVNEYNGPLDPPSVELVNGQLGFVVGHVMDKAIVSFDSAERNAVIVPETMLRRARA